MNKSSLLVRSLCVALSLSFVFTFCSLLGRHEEVSAATVTNTLICSEEWNRPGFGIFNANAAFTVLNNVYTHVGYNVLPIVVDTSGEYTITDITGNYGDTIIYVYENAFDPLHPNDNFLCGNDDYNFFAFSLKSVYLNAGTAYYLVISTYNLLPLTTSITFSITGVGTARSTVDMNFSAETGGVISGTSSQSVSVGASGSEVVAVPDTGYDFVSWSDGVTTAARTDSNCIADLSVSANFALQTFQIAFDSQGGSSIPSQTISYNHSISSAIPTREGYTFSGWYYDAACTNKVAETDVFTSADQLFAGWTINTYTVTFQDYNQVVLGVQTVNYDASATTPTPPVREGYTFTGWSQSYASVKGNVVTMAVYVQNTGVLGTSIVTPTPTPTPTPIPTSTPTPTPVSDVAGVTKTGETGGNIFFTYAIVLLAFSGLALYFGIKPRKESDLE